MGKDVLRMLKIFLYVDREVNWRRNIYSIIFDNLSFP